MLPTLIRYLDQVRNNTPLVLCITNSVTTDFVANGILSVHAVPVMSEYEEDALVLLKLSRALYLNTGTFNQNTIPLYHTLAQEAQRTNIVTVLDPAGSGATPIRTAINKQLLNNINILKGNASEVISLEHNLGQSRGVESSHSVAEAKTIAINLAQQYNMCVAVSGKEDFITDGEHHHTLTRGNAMMTKVTGVGCVLGGVIAAFAAVSDNYHEASVMAILYYTMCADIAYRTARGPAEFKMLFLDILYQQPIEEIAGILNERPQ